MLKKNLANCWFKKGYFKSLFLQQQIQKNRVWRLSMEHEGFACWLHF